MLNTNFLHSHSQSMRPRLDISFYFLSVLFNKDERRVSELYQMTQAAFHSIHNSLLGFYTNVQDPTEDQLNEHLGKFNQNNGEVEDEFRAAFKDPHPTLKGRVAYCLVADSKKVDICKSTEKRHQMDHYYAPSNRHKLTFLTFCTLNGTPAWAGIATASSTPR